MNRRYLLMIVLTPSVLSYFPVHAKYLACRLPIFTKIVSTDAMNLIVSWLFLINSFVYCYYVLLYFSFV